jgi:hypothetical protein
MLLRSCALHLHRLPIMDALRKRKGVACKSTGDRVLRSRSGRVVSEQTLADALQSKTIVSDTVTMPPARGLSVADDSAPSSTKPENRNRGSRRGARQAASAALLQTNSAPPVLAGAAAESAPDLPDTPPASAGPAVSLAAPTSWTEESMAAALDHLCKADPCASSSLLSFVHH